MDLANFQKSNRNLTQNQLRSDCVMSLENASVQFTKIKAIDSISINITRGEILFVTGASGAGKSTLLNVLAGQLAITNGKSYLLYKNTNLFVARIFQDLQLIPNMTCYENLEIAYDSSIYSSRKNFNDELIELCRVVGVDKFLNEKIQNLNGGAKQKIATIRALLTRPDILIADEPTCSMDNESASKLFDIVNYYNTKRSLTVIWATHDRELVRTFPGKILHLDQGRLVYSGHACFI